MERDLQSDTFHNDLVISTHTLTWSVTRKLKKKENGIADFNSHAHVERDHDTMCYNIDIVISTHTLTWSVTVCLYFEL